MRFTVLICILFLILSQQVSAADSRGTPGRILGADSGQSARTLAGGVRQLQRLSAGDEASVRTLESALPAGYRIMPARTVWYDDLNNPTSGTQRLASQYLSKSRSFYVNNPITVYGGLEMLVPNPDTGAVRFSDSFPLDGDDVIVLYGRTPPPITYYSFVANQYNQLYEEVGDFLETNSSIGLTVNQNNINTQGGAMHNAFFVLLIGADKPSLDMAAQFLVNLGIPQSVHNRLLIPGRFTTFNNEFPDELNFITRMTFRSEQELTAILDYIGGAKSPIGALLFDGPGGPGDVVDADLPRWEDTLRANSEEWDQSGEEHRDLIAAQLVTHFEQQGYQLFQEGIENMRHIDPQLYCRDAAISCNFDAPDALYGNFRCKEPGAGGIPGPCNFPLPNNEDQVFVIGLDHHEYANDTLSTYFSYAVTRLEDLRGVAAIADVELEGSATEWTTGTGVDPDKFFVVRVSRDCGADPFCMQVPLLKDGGVGPNQPVRISTRIYLDSITATAPNPDSIVPAKLLWFVKE